MLLLGELLGMKSSRGEEKNTFPYKNVVIQISAMSQVVCVCIVVFILGKIQHWIMCKKVCDRNIFISLDSQQNYFIELHSKGRNFCCFALLNYVPYILYTFT